MQATKKTFEKQLDKRRAKTIDLGLGESASASQNPPTGGVGIGDDSLLYLSCLNSDNEVNEKKKKKKKKPIRKGDTGWKGDDWTPNNKDYKIVKSLRENIKHWGKKWGHEKIFFLTLTFKENVTDPKVAEERFNNFNRQFTRLPKVQWLYKGVEPQHRGALHFHLIGVHEEDLGAEQFDWEAYKKASEAFSKGNKGLGYKWTKEYSKSANKPLKEMWGKVAKIAKGSKMGRSEFLPVRSANCIGNYVGKYLGKCFASQNNHTWPKGMKRFSYSRKAPQVHGRQFSWVSNKGMLTWRKKVANWAYGVGVKDSEDMVRKYGNMWAVKYKEDINYYGVRWEKENKEKHYGHAKPTQYPTGVIGNVLGNMGTAEKPSNFEEIEQELWEKFHATHTNRRGLKHHAEHFRKHSAAKKHAEFNERVYG